MNNNQAIALINGKQEQHLLSIKNTHWANLSIYGGKDGWWLNVPFNKLEEQLYFILNNKQLGQMYFINIPSNSIANPLSVFRNKGNKADIFIDAINGKKLRNVVTLIDKQSNGTEYDFSACYVETLKYSAGLETVESLYPE